MIPVAWFLSVRGRLWLCYRQVNGMLTRAGEGAEIVGERQQDISREYVRAVILNVILGNGPVHTVVLGENIQNRQFYFGCPVLQKLVADRSIPVDSALIIILTKAFI